MAEVLAIASGVAGLISLTIDVIQISSDYITKVHNASNTVQRFLRELEDLKSVLIKIDQIAKNADDRELFGEDPSCLLSIRESNQYLELLRTIRRKLEKRSTDGSFRQKLKALTWPFSEDRTIGLIEALHRHLEMYKTALALDNLTVGKLTLKEVRQSKVAQQDTQVDAVLDWLSPLNMFQRQQDTLSRRHGNTGSWLLSVPAFRRWVNSESSDRTLWCPGDPGTGKTVITSIVVDHLIKNVCSDDVRIAYIYCDYKDQAMQTASNLIACLARQLIGRPQKLPQQLKSFHKEWEQQRRRPNVEELKMLLVMLCNERERTYVIVDALDECEATNERRSFLPLLQSLPHGSTRLFVTSRPNHEDIYYTFTTASQITIAAPDSEIERFVTEKIEERKEFVERVTQDLKSQIISTICARASGMFLLAALQIDRICVARTVKKIKSALTSMPSELDDLYRETLERIQKQAGEDGQLGMRVLSWITHTREAFVGRRMLIRSVQLRHGLAVECDDDEQQPDEFDPENLLSPRSLIDVCAGLVVIDPGSQIIRLVHYTTQEFFDRERLRLFKGAEVDISTACLTYLSYNIFSEFPSERLVSDTLHWYPFLGYAALNWFFHASIGEPDDSVEVWSKAVDYVNDSARILFCSMVLRKLLLRSRSYSHLKEDDIRDRARSLPLECAAECGQLRLVTFLLGNASGSKAALDNSLQCASFEGHTDIVKLLISSGANVESLSSDSSNALQKACKGGHLEVAKLLIESGANVNISDRWIWTPLHHAAHGNHSGLVALLLAHGANPHAQSPLGLTACHLAASRGNADTVKLLLDHNIDLKLTTRDKRTVLHSAAESAEPGYLEVVTLLLTSGCNALAKDQDGQTALDLVPNNSSMLARGVFSAYMEASLGEQETSTNMEGSAEASSITPVPPRQMAREENAVPQSDIMADHIWEKFQTSLGADAEAYFGAVPAVNLAGATPPDSPTGSTKMDGPIPPLVDSPQGQGDNVPMSASTEVTTIANATASTPHGPPGECLLEHPQSLSLGSQAYSEDEAENPDTQHVSWEVPSLNVIECSPPGSPTKSGSAVPIPWERTQRYTKLHNHLQKNT